MGWRAGCAYTRLQCCAMWFVAVAGDGGDACDEAVHVAGHITSNKQQQQQLVGQGVDRFAMHAGSRHAGAARMSMGVCPHVCPLASCVARVSVPPPACWGGITSPRDGWWSATLAE